jgi:hypothetical protein
VRAAPLVDQCGAVAAAEGVDRRVGLVDERDLDRGELAAGGRLVVAFVVVAALDPADLADRVDGQLQPVVGGGLADAALDRRLSCRFGRGRGRGGVVATGGGVVTVAGGGVGVLLVTTVGLGPTRPSP